MDRKTMWIGEMKLKKKEWCIVLEFLALLVLIVLFRTVHYDRSGVRFIALLQCMIYIGVCIAWGRSVHRRVMQIQVRQYLLVIIGLMIFWFVIRTIKYSFVTEIVFKRYLWYLYYLPMLFIPLYAVFTAMLLGKSERVKLPKYTVIPAGISLLLFVLVMTNDWHQLVFTFQKGKLWSDVDYGYARGYYVIVVWLLLCGLAILTLLLYKCRVPHSRQFIWLPGVPIIMLVIYTILYLLRVKWLFALLGDLPAVFCLLYAAVLESCMQTGLIQTNTGYDLLFEAATFQAQITDEGWNTLYSSGDSALDAEILSRAEKGALLLDRNTLLKTHVITGGHVVWQEDVTEVADTLQQLEENQQELEEETLVEQQALLVNKAVLRLKEKNRLYDMIGKHTRKQVELLNALLEKYEEASGENARRKLLEKICVVGVYVKRSGNLLLVGESNDTIPVLELIKALEESLQNLELAEVECGITCTVASDIPSVIALEIYGFYEQIIEATMEYLDYLWINLRMKGQKLLLHMELESEMDLSFLSDKGKLQFEDGVWFVTVSYQMGGRTE